MFFLFFAPIIIFLSLSLLAFQLAVIFRFTLHITNNRQCPPILIHQSQLLLHHRYIVIIIITITMDLLHKLTQQSLDSGDLNRKKLEAAHQQHVFSNLVPLENNNNSNSNNNNDDPIQFVFAATDQTHFFLGTKSNNVQNHDCIILSSCQQPPKDNNGSSSVLLTVITALHLIHLEKSEFVMIAVYNNQQIYGWKVEMQPSQSSTFLDLDEDQDKQHHNKKYFSDSHPILIGFVESQTNITSIMDVPFPSSAIHYVVFGSDSSSCSVCCLEVRRRTTKAKQPQQQLQVRNRPVLKHFSVKSKHSRIIVDRRKMTVSIVYDKDYEVKQNLSQQQPRKDRHFLTYFLPAVFSKTRQTTSFTTKSSGLVSSGRYSPNYSSSSSNNNNYNNNQQDILKSPIVCHRKLVLEDADRLRGFFVSQSSVQDREIVTEALLHFSPSETNFDDNTNVSSKTIYNDETAEEGARRFFENPYWLSGGLSTISSDVCSVLVDFPRLVQNLRTVLNLHQKTISSPGYSHYFEQQMKQYSNINRTNNNNSSPLPPLVEENILYNRAIKISEFALRLLLSRPDVPRRPLLKTSNNSIAASRNASMVLPPMNNNTSSTATQQYIDDDDDHDNKFQNFQQENEDEDEEFFDFNCVARIPQKPDERAEFGVFAIALATSLPSSTILRDILQTFSDDYAHLNNSNGDESNNSSVMSHSSSSASPSSQNNNNSNSSADTEFIFFAVAGMIVDVTWPKNTQRNRTKVLSEFLMTIIPFLLFRDPTKDNTSTNTLLRNSSKFLFGACLDRLVSKEKFKLEEILVAKLQNNNNSASEGSKEEEESSVTDEWEVAAKNLHPPEALIALLLLIRSVQVMLAAAAASSPSVSRPGSPTTAVSMTMTPERGNNNNNSSSSIRQNHSSSSLQSNTSSNGSRVSSVRQQQAKHGGLSQKEIEELGNYSPSPNLVNAVGLAVVDTAKNYRCRSVSSAISTHQNNNNENRSHDENKDQSSNGIALQVISEGWNIFGGFVPVSERKLMVARMMMDAVIRYDISANGVLSWTPLAINNNNGSIMNLSTPGGHDSPDYTAKITQYLETTELSATFPIVKMLSKIASTMNLSRAIELFAWVCTLEGSDGTHQELKIIAKEANIHDNIGVSIVVMRVLTHLIEIQPIASRRFIHNILSFVWASIDPSVMNMTHHHSHNHDHHQTTRQDSSSSSFGDYTSRNNSLNNSSIQSFSPNNNQQQQTSLPPLRSKSRLPFVARLFRTASEYIPTFSFHQSSQRVLASSGEDGKVVLYDSKSTSKLAVFGPAVVSSSASTSNNNNNSSSPRHLILAVSFSPNGDACALLQQYINDGTLSLAVYSIDEGNSFFSTFGLAAATTCNLKGEVPVVKGGGQIATVKNVQMTKPRVSFASPKCAIVSFGAQQQDLMVHF